MTIRARYLSQLALCFITKAGIQPEKRDRLVLSSQPEGTRGGWNLKRCDFLVRPTVSTQTLRSCLGIVATATNLHPKHCGSFGRWPYCLPQTG